jgi:uncharacterized small protein (DUF1192 family)
MAENPPAAGSHTELQSHYVELQSRYNALAEEITRLEAAREDAEARRSQMEAHYSELQGWYNAVLGELARLQNLPAPLLGQTGMSKIFKSGAGRLRRGVHKIALKSKPSQSANPP